MLRLDQTIPESSLLITAVHFPIHLFKINILSCFPGLKRKQVTLLNTVTMTHLEYLRNTSSEYHPHSLALHTFHLFHDF